MRLIYDNDGILAVVIPTPEFLATLISTEEEKLIHIANKDLPTGTKYEIIGDDVDLSDRSFRNAWEYVAGSDEKTSVDLPRADQFKYNQIQESDLTDEEKIEFGLVQEEVGDKDAVTN
jgi:hypothetical protein